MAKFGGYANYNAAMNRSPNTRTTKLTEHEKSSIVLLARQRKLTYRQIADQFSISVPYVSMIVKAAGGR